MHAVIVGGGLAGLSAAVSLKKEGIDITLLEASDRLGGRLRTDLVDGFRCDRGFQVAFSAYPALAALVDLPALQPKRFEPGSLHWDGNLLQEVHRDKPLAMALSSFLPLGDKVRVLQLTQRVKSRSIEQLFAAPDQPASEYLRALGFSTRFIERFAKPFFGGIFLDTSLQVSSRMFTYIWKMLSEGDTFITADGIQAIPDALASQLPPDSVRLESPVASLLREGDTVRGVVLASGETVEADAVIVATEADTGARLTGLELPVGSKSSTCVYFEAPEPPVDRPILVLNSSGTGRVNEVVPISVVAPSLAPPGRHLVSATILGWVEEAEAPLAESIKAEVAPWFPGKGVDHWLHLRTDRIRYAQMPQPAGIFDRLPSHETSLENLYLAGEFNVSSSIQGALQAGVQCAKLISGKRS